MFVFFVAERPFLTMKFGGKVHKGKSSQAELLYNDKVVARITARGDTGMAEASFDLRNNLGRTFTLRFNDADDKHADGYIMADDIRLSEKKRGHTQRVDTLLNKPLVAALAKTHSVDATLFE